jgi:hypothetical protein
VLFFEDSTDVGVVVPRLAQEPTWNQIIEHLLCTRYKCTAVDYQVSEIALLRFQDFTREIAEQMRSLLEYIRPYAAWVGELAPRVALVLEAFDPKPGCEIDEHIAQRAVNISRWLAAAHIRTVSAVLQPSADNADRSAALAKIRLKAPVSYRELWRSFDQPRAGWFRPALQSLIDSGQIVCDSGRRFIPAPVAGNGSAGSAS